MNTAVSQHTMILRDNKGYTFWPLSGLMTRIKDGVFYNFMSGVRSQPSETKVHVYRKRQNA